MTRAEKKKYQSEQLMVLHQHTEAMYKLGFVSVAEMREWDEDCLVPEAAAAAAGRGRVEGAVSTAAPSQAAGARPRPKAAVAAAKA